MDLRSIALARAVAGERRVHNDKIEVPVSDAPHQVAYFLRPSAAGGVSGGRDNVEGGLLLQKVE